MKSNARRWVALAVISGACWNGLLTNGMAQGNRRAQEEAARAKDPAWKPSCEEVATIQVGDSGKPGSLKNFCLNTDGNILACYVPKGGKAPDNAAGIRVYSPKGELLKTLPLDIKPGAICVAKDGSIFVAGDGRVLKLDQNGKVVASAESPVANQPVVITSEMDEMIEESAKQMKRSVEQVKQDMKRSLEMRRLDVTGLAVTDQDVFMATGAPSDFSYRVYRFDRSLQNPKLVVEKLRGCCGQMDIQSHDGKLWIPHNARHTVEARDRDGKQLAKFGKAGKVKATDFGGCCEPKNMRVLANGDILAAESGPPTCIKRFSSTGEFKEVVAVLQGKGDCVRVTVETDGTRYYMLDTARDAIRVFAAK